MLSPAALCAQTATPAPAAAPTAGAQSFEPTFFARFAPRNALDMVRQLPGFSIQQGNGEDVRGLGQATQNVLIDGKRISGKSNDAVTALGRINASDVVRIEIIDGATLDIPGLSGQVANIVTAVKGLTGTFRYNPQLRAKRTDPRLLDGEVSLSGQSGALSYTLSAANQSRRNGNAGPETVYDGLGRITDVRPEVLFVNEEHPRLSGAFKYEPANGDIVNLNLQLNYDRNEVLEDSIRIDRHRDYAEVTKAMGYEIGGDYEFGVGSGRLKLIGLGRYQHKPGSTRVVFDFVDGRADTGNIFDRTGDESEAILRAEYRWKGGGADWQVSAEGALNALDYGSSLADLNAAGVFVPQPINGGDATVREKRGEIYISYGRPLTRTLTLQSSLGVEYSNLRQSGAGGLNRTFYRPKGFVSLAWKATPRLDISAKVERVVGQLDFFDFVASVNLAGENSNAANPNLRPPQNWLVQLEVNRNLGAWGSAKLRLFGKRFTDAVSQVPIGATGEAPGNIASADAYGLRFTGTILFDPIGWKGAKVDIDYIANHSRLHDPLTNEIVQFSEDDRNELNVNFRYDLPATSWAVGVDYYKYIQTPGVRLDQTSQFVMKPGDLGVFVENKDVFGLTVRGGVGNLLGTNERFYRTVHAGRRTDPIAFTEDRSRFFGPVFTLNISGSF